MKILQIANGDFFSTYGGGQVYVKNLVDEMINRRLEVVVFSFVNKKSKVAIQKQNYKGIDLYEIYQKDENSIKILIREMAPDVIHIHAGKAFFTRISRALSISTVVTVHHGGIVCPAGTLLNCRDEICHVPVSHRHCLCCVLRNTKTGLFFYPLLKKLPLPFRLKIGKILAKLPFMYFVTPLLSSDWSIQQKQKEWHTIIKNTDLMIAPSYAIAGSMILNRFPEEKTVVIPHGIPFCHSTPDAESPAKEIAGLIRVKFFYTGRIAYIKGIHNLLKAFCGLDTSQCELHLIGDLPEAYAQKLYRQYKNNPAIFFHGKIQPGKVADFIRPMDILVHPAISLEVFGLNIGEALLEKKPVIATRCGGAEMQIEDGENGLLVEPNNVDELQNAMQWMLDNPEEVRRMLEKADKRVVSMTEHVRLLSQLYDNLINT